MTDDAEVALDADAQRNFPVPSFEDLPTDLKERIAAEAERAGFTPNVFAALAYRPEQFRPFVAFHDALVDGGELDRAEVEMIVVAVSGVNDCLYCTVAHGALCRIYADDPELADQLVTNHRSADLPERHRVMLDVAVKLTEHPERVTAADRDRLLDVGFSREAAWDVAAVAAFFNLSNRLATFADWRPNAEFYTLGR
ncbi:peroxidase-related enzyme [Halorubrum sp. JWXQ-INN 858]|uniref:peroxidase-related enzyme n=1 Tax=Halorubrum sp. JWXQ-INN 858 TaxID=2690782 RepID=UPI00135AFF9C|nr:peroxidase-related enzyme [Halorubrum sp. JWXQ-INN 858]MWV64261.1 peroxidase-related enzyme [Halorubrum sp. JWXQ-INN 858]